MSRIISIKETMSRSERMKARKHNLNLAIEQMKQEEAKKPAIKLSDKDRIEARKLIKKIIEAA